MSILQQQAIQRISIMSDDNVSFLLEIIDRLISGKKEEADTNVSSNRRIGIAEQIDMYDAEYDFDEYNNEIALMFGVSE